MQRSKAKIEEKQLEFEFEILNVQFNELGRYALRLTLENPLLEGSGTGVQLRVNDGDVLFVNTGTSDIIEQRNLNDIHAFQRRKFAFTLPKGFCKNDKNHDVRLRIEALRVKGSSVKNGKKAGEAFFAIYPRTNQPRTNLYAKKEEDLYNYSSIMALLRVQNDELAMHCGRLAFTASFHEVRASVQEALPPSRLPSPFPLSGAEQGGQTPRAPSPAPQKLLPPPSPVPQDRKPSPHPVTPIPQPSQHPVVPPLTPKHVPKADPVLPETSEPLPESSDESLPPTPKEERDPPPPQRVPSEASLHFSTPESSTGQSPPPLPHSHVMEAPPGRTEPVHSAPTNDWHVSRPGKESISVILHGATNLPPLSDGTVPQAFASVKSSSDEKKQQSAQGISHASLQPTHSPSWEEKVTLEIDEEKADDEEVILNVADSRTKELLASYRLPVHYLHPFHHYHLELVQAHRSVPSGVRVYATMVRKGNLIPRQAGFSFTGFEVLLRAVEKPFKDPVGPLLVVARIVSDYESYKDTMLIRNPRAAGVPVTTIQFPNPPPSSFEVPHLSSHGHPQVSQAGFPPDQPVWNQSFLFQGRDSATIFTAGAALVLEYYSITTVMDMVSWHIRSPLGFSVVPLNQDVYQKLMAERGRRGIRIQDLPIEGTSLRTTDKAIPTVGLVLNLIGSERPDALLGSANLSLLPVLNPQPLDYPENESVEVTSGLPQPLLDVGGSRTPESAQEDKEEETKASLSAVPQERALSPLEKLQRDETSFPSHDALAEILPEYEYLFRAKGQQEQLGQQKQTEPWVPALSHQRHDEGPPQQSLGTLSQFGILSSQPVEISKPSTACLELADF
nr:PREDICTED: coiled-coil domain-containing protein 33 [Latimeria chalumnae]|eukprot:XP_014344342.1 PREDICTED: coiled-coil domain-containing protein 33 [Latimeria chalumnae]